MPVGREKQQLFCQTLLGTTIQIPKAGPKKSLDQLDHLKHTKIPNRRSLGELLMGPSITIVKLSHFCMQNVDIKLW